MNRLYPIQEWSKFRTGVGAENADRQLTTTNKNWDQRNDNRLQTTSGTLKIGTKYTLQDWKTGDDFSNVGAINEDGHIFTATATTPVDDDGNASWETSSVIEEWGTERFRNIPANASVIYLAFMGAKSDDPNNGTASVFIHLYRKKGPAQLVGDYDLVVGDQDVVRYPYPPYATIAKKNWVDTITINGTSPWIQDPNSVGNVADGIAMLRIPVFGAAGINVEVDAVGSGITLDVLMSSSNQALGPA